LKPASFRHISTASFRFVANRAQSLSDHSYKMKVKYEEWW
jgi:hypothetical protein